MKSLLTQAKFIWKVRIWSLVSHCSKNTASVNLNIQFGVDRYTESTRDWIVFHDKIDAGFFQGIGKLQMVLLSSHWFSLRGRCWIEYRRGRFVAVIIVQRTSYGENPAFLSGKNPTTAENPTNFSDVTTVYNQTWTRREEVLRPIFRRNYYLDLYFIFVNKTKWTGIRVLIPSTTFDSLLLSFFI